MPENDSPKVVPPVKKQEAPIEAPKPVLEPPQQEVPAPQIIPKMEVKEESKVENLIETQNHVHEDLNIVNKLIEKHESRIKEIQSEVVQVSSSKSSHVVSSNKNDVSYHQGSCFYVLYIYIL